MEFVFDENTRIGKIVTQFSAKCTDIFMKKRNGRKMDANCIKKPLKRFVFKGFLVRDEGLEPPRSPART